MIASIAAVDFESARRRDGSGDVPIQIGIAVASDAGQGILASWSSYLDPGGEVYPGPGLRDERLLAGAPSLLSLWTPIASLLRGKVILAHAAGTEKRFLRAFPGHGFGPWIDTLRLVRAAYPTAPSHALGDICTASGVREKLLAAGFSQGWHDALYDAAATALLFQHLQQSYHVDLANPEGLAKLSSPDLAKYFAHRRRT